MALVGDIARRLAIMNPSLENPLLGEGIILVDEIDMHLHPTWQREIINRLTTTFPNCQFILTTHSPLVISDYKDTLVYSIDNGQLMEEPPQYGLDANTVLLDAMDTDIRNREVTVKINDLLDLIQEKKFEKAKILLSELEADLAENNIELIKAKMLLRKQEIKHA
ncbi:AAA family ATPase [Acerihabitans sp. KWT182]|uniref:AAA family ATPase n=1 Tax=Acerihabitans sp. KWT182 TaxID=3157919 RepID=A0AAU7Q5C8_9GAMM